MKRARASRTARRASPRPGGEGKGPEAVRRALRARRARRVLLVGHVRADGDCLGSELALAAILRAMGRSVRIVNPEPIPPPYREFLPRAGSFRTPPPGTRPIPADLVVILDTPTLERTGAVAGRLPEGVPRVNLDHHVSNRRFGTVNWVDASASSVAEMVWRLARDGARGPGALPLPREALYGIYLGIATDTGRFAFSNTTPAAHRIAAEALAAGVPAEEIHRSLYYRRHPAELDLERRALARLERLANGQVASVALSAEDFRSAGVGPEYAREFADLPRSLAGVRAAVFFCEADGGARTHVSLRTAPGLDADRIAAAFGGGGHPRAAGCDLPGGLAAAKPPLYAEILRRLARPDRATGPRPPRPR